MRLVVLILIALALPMSVFADDWNANINVVLTTPEFAGCSGNHLGILESMVCEDLVSTPIEGIAFLWVVMSDGDVFPDGIGGIQFGIEHEKDMQGWSLCTGGAEIPEDGWPASGTGNAATWGGGCYYPPGENAVVGFFTLNDGASGWMAITEDPRVGTALWSDCVPVSQDFAPELLGSLDNSTGGDPNCDEIATPTIESSWGRVKAHY